MTRSRATRWIPAVALAAAMAAVPSWSLHASPRQQTIAGVSALPARLSDAEFWKLVTDISEPGGYFRITDNYTSNEPEIGRLLTMLRSNGVKGGVYIGVGPEQNLSYISAIRPSMAFVIDIRRQAVMQHLMFKAVFELSKDRADFISLLFSKPRPEGLDASMSIGRMWDLFYGVPTDAVLADKNAVKIVDRLVKTHEFMFTADESEQLTAVLHAFVSFGPGISTRGASGPRDSAMTFAGLTSQSYDDAGTPQSFMASEEQFQVVKALHEKNLIVPVSGDFGGPKALRAIGDYVRKKNATVSAYYLSNVEQYLFGDGKQRAFYANVASLPLTDTSVFIRPYALRRPGGPPLCPIAGFLRAFDAGRVYSNTDALACTR